MAAIGLAHAMASPDPAQGLELVQQLADLHALEPLRAGRPPNASAADFCRMVERPDGGRELVELAAVGAADLCHAMPPLPDDTFPIASATAAVQLAA